MRVEMILKIVSHRWSTKSIFTTSKRSGEPVSSKFETCTQASVAGTCAVGSMRCWSWNAGTRLLSFWSTGLTGLGKILTADRRTRIAGVALHAKCCVKHFRAIYKTARIYEKSINNSSDFCRWRCESISSLRHSPKVQRVKERREMIGVPRRSIADLKKWAEEKIGLLMNFDIGKIKEGIRRLVV